VGGPGYPAVMTAKSAHDGDAAGLLPRHLNYGDVTIPFLYNTLSAMQWMSDESSVQQYLRAYPQAHRAIIALSRAITDVGLRIRRASRDRDIYDEHLGHFTADEIWMFDLAIDVVAMFATGGGLHQETSRSVQDKLREADEHVHSHHWQREVRKAGAGPAQYHELRALIPHHKPRG
jgi:hypothetical protein